MFFNFSCKINSLCIDDGIKCERLLQNMFKYICSKVIFKRLFHRLRKKPRFNLITV